MINEKIPEYEYFVLTLKLKKLKFLLLSSYLLILPFSNELRQIILGKICLIKNIVIEDVNFALENNSELIQKTII